MIDKTIKQVSKFKHLGYLISDHRRNMEIKLKHYYTSMPLLREIVAKKCYQKQR
jgi:hypothetical protein